jgi:hypothetical protein
MTVIFHSRVGITRCQASLVAHDHHHHKHNNGIACSYSTSSCSARQDKDAEYQSPTQQNNNNKQSRRRRYFGTARPPAVWCSNRRLLLAPLLLLLPAGCDDDVYLVSVVDKETTRPTVELLSTWRMTTTAVSVFLCGCVVRVGKKSIKKYYKKLGFNGAESSKCNKSLCKSSPKDRF